MNCTMANSTSNNPYMDVPHIFKSVTIFLQYSLFLIQKQSEQINVLPIKVQVGLLRKWLN